MLRFLGLFVFCNALMFGEMHDRILMHDGLARTYKVYVPDSIDSSVKMPLLILLHGGGGSAKSIVKDGEWMDKADKEGIILVIPNGTSAEPDKPSSFIRNQQTWNAGDPKVSPLGAVRRQVDDVGFLDSLLDEVQASFPYDAKRVFVSGFSNGGTLSFVLARKLSQRFAALAPVGCHDVLKDAPQDRVMPIIYIVGAEDPLAPLDGGPIYIGKKYYGESEPKEDLIQRWVGFHKITEEPAQLEENKARGRRYKNSDGEVIMEAWIVDGLGHHWPGSPQLLPQRLAGPHHQDFSAVEYIWDFFEKQSL